MRNKPRYPGGILQNAIHGSHNIQAIVRFQDYHLLIAIDLVFAMGYALYGFRVVPVDDVR